jgi:hypothetical protein
MKNKRPISNKRGSISAYFWIQTSGFFIRNSPVVLLSKEYNSFDEFFKAFSGVI